MATSNLNQWFTARRLDVHSEFGARHRGVSTVSDSADARAVTLVWMLVDILTVVVAATLATRLREVNALGYFDNRGPFHNVPPIFLIYLAGFSLILLFVSRAHGLYGSLQSMGGLHEQRLTVQACLISGLVLAGALYLSRETSVSRAIVMATLFTTCGLLCVRRAVWRMIRYRRYDQGLETRNVLVIGTGSSGLAIRSHLQRIRHLGFTFKGFVETAQERIPADAHESICIDESAPSQILGSLPELSDLVRRHFIDEIFVTGPCDRGVVKHLIGEASEMGVDVRVVPDLYDGITWSAPIEYVGQFPTMPVHRHQTPFVGLIFKRPLDLLISICALLILSPLMLVIALAVRLDSRGPIFYCAERIGRKGRKFSCWKFRTMVADADFLQEQFLKLNERDGVLFKIKKDPRVTNLGRFLRKYSLDELPQFFNVLVGDMSVVGPRPPMAREVHQYELPHLRRLEVLPGITGLWQVQARQDPSFDQYISLDTAYIDNWSLWLDLKIIARTVGVVVSGTGS